MRDMCRRYLTPAPPPSPSNHTHAHNQARTHIPTRTQAPPRTVPPGGPAAAAGPPWSLGGTSRAPPRTRRPCASACASTLQGIGQQHTGTHAHAHTHTHTRMFKETYTYRNICSGAQHARSRSYISKYARPDEEAADGQKRRSDTSKTTIGRLSPHHLHTHKHHSPHTHLLRHSMRCESAVFLTTAAAQPTEPSHKKP